MGKNLTDDFFVTELENTDPISTGTPLMKESRPEIASHYFYKIKSKAFQTEKSIKSEFIDWHKDSKDLNAFYKKLFLKTAPQPELFNKVNEVADDLFKSRSVILNENWPNIINLQSIVVSFNKDLVQCECLIDKENKIFQTRSFPSIVFNNITNIAKGIPVLISIKSKPGSIRIDVVDGTHFVDKNLFDSNKNWQRLENKFKKASIKVFNSQDA